MMRIYTEIWIVDSSPIILLGKIGLPHLLPKISGGVTIPQAVVDEVNQAPPEDLGRKALATIIQTERTLVYEPGPKPAVDAFGLGAGEAAVLSAVLDRAGYKMAVIAVMDELRGRKAAASLGVPTLGTVGVLIRAKDEDEISRLVPHLYTLRAAGAWISDDFCREVARGVGEAWP